MDREGARSGRGNDNYHLGGTIHELKPARVFQKFATVLCVGMVFLG